MLKFLFSKSFLTQAVLAIIVSALLILGAYFFLINYAKTGEAVTVPELNGLDIIEADAELQLAKLSPEVIDSVYQQDLQGGIIVDQNPRAGSMVKKKRKIYLTISRYGIPTLKLPNVLNQTSAIAISKLTRRGFEIGNLKSKTDPCDGCAIGLEFKGKSISVDDNIPVGSTIDLIIGKTSDGAVSSVPALFGLTLDQATMILHEFDLNRGAYIYDEENVKTAGDTLSARVYSQSIKPGESIKLGSPINLSLTIDEEKIPTVNIDSIIGSLPK